jgi:hypothetical protein
VRAVEAEQGTGVIRREPDGHLSAVVRVVFGQGKDAPHRGTGLVIELRFGQTQRRHLVGMALQLISRETVQKLGIGKEAVALRAAVRTRPSLKAQRIPSRLRLLRGGYSFHTRSCRS